MRMLVLGAGLQGSACAYDLLQNPEVTQVRLADLHFDHLPSFLKPSPGRDSFPRRSTSAIARPCSPSCASATP